MVSHLRVLKRNYLENLINFPIPYVQFSKKKFAARCAQAALMRCLDTCRANTAVAGSVEEAGAMVAGFGS